VLLSAEQRVRASRWLKDYFEKLPRDFAFYVTSLLLIIIRVLLNYSVDLNLQSIIASFGIIFDV
jgi:hypothetical protein